MLYSIIKNESETGESTIIYKERMKEKERKCILKKEKLFVHFSVKIRKQIF